MRQATVRVIYDWLNGIAPFDTAEGFDNVGLLLGAMDAPVTRVLVALDATPAVAREAAARGAQLILTHHPLFFHPRKDLREDDYEGALICDMIRNNLALISAHTNLDITEHSGTAALCELLALQNRRMERYIALGELPASPVRAGELLRTLREFLQSPVCLYGDADASVRTVAVAGGEYGVGFDSAIRLGADVFVTGEVKHHQAIEAAARGLPIIGAGHFATENILVPRLCKCLQNAMNAVEYQVEVYPSACAPYGVRMA